MTQSRTTLGEEEALRLLSDGEIRPLGLMPRASNYTFLAEVSSGEQTALAVYKPREGETPLWDFPDGTLCLREVAAYLLSKELGWPSVPPTVLREGPHGLASVQLFVDAAAGEHFFTLRERCLEEFMPVAAFDVVANNADRKSGHCLLDPDGKVWVVDHGVCFSEDPKLRTVIWDFAGEPVPPNLREDLVRLAKALKSGESRRAFEGLLAARELDATAARAERLARSGRFPFPRTERSYPWPPV
ncbi:MAG TPA: SCO1664 family protein [Actinomycetota bacterium]|nr:SCO1664 family protein [Actinomycetota bacterium]